MEPCTSCGSEIDSAAHLIRMLLDGRSDLENLLREASGLCLHY